MRMALEGEALPKGHEALEVFTTRPDTIFGMSFCAVSPDHPLATALAKKDKKLKSFIDECHRMGTSVEEIERAEKKGYDTGLKVVHPVPQDVESAALCRQFHPDGLWHGRDFRLPGA